MKRSDHVLPNFLIVGAQKCGTTWLASLLRQHPDVYMPEAEIHFFDKACHYARGTDWYERHFAGARDEKAIGEKTPDYFWANGQGGEGHLPNVHRNIHNVLPDAKLIVALKNPVERAISAVKHIIRSGRISPFHKIDDLLVGEKRDLLEGYGVFEMGKFHTLLEAYLELFEPDQILILVFEEDIVENPSRGLRKVCRFLDIEPSWEFSNMDAKANAFNSSIVHLTVKYHLPFLSWLSRPLEAFLPAARYTPGRPVIEHLYRVYEEENKRLFALLKRQPPESWLPPP